MADVPAWLLVVNTALAGSFGLAGTWLVPRSQREARRQQAREAGAAIMRAKAEELFNSIEQVRQESKQAMLAAWQLLDPADEPQAVLPFPSLDKVKALAAVYYPGALPLIISCEKELRAIDDETPRRLEDALTKPEPAAAMRMSHISTAERYSKAISASADRLNAFLIEAVRPYHPNAVSKA